jgi:hypothetical protein
MPHSTVFTDFLDSVLWSSVICHHPGAVEHDANTHRRR